MLMDDWRDSYWDQSFAIVDILEYANEKAAENETYFIHTYGKIYMKKMISTLPWTSRNLKKCIILSPDLVSIGKIL